ncbi:MAG: hypothetical protein KJ044_07750 [Planctomycetes bacterium]|nr:hypothetical protein [Planctomycetota bacterium]
MHKAIVHSDYGTKLPLEFSRPVEVFQDKFPTEPRKPGMVRVLFLCEPVVIKNLRRKTARFAAEFDHILTFDPWVLRRFAHATKFVYGTAWVGRQPERKEFSISSVIGTKTITKGHRLRQKFWRKSAKITNPLKLYFSRQFTEAGISLPPDSLMLGEDKHPPFESQFHVAIENCRAPDYFTEKIVDCFRTRTVPIYWGCTNIAQYFNPRGMIVARTLWGLIRACNRVTPQTWDSMRDAIEDNYRRAEQYLDLDLRLAKLIRQLVEPAPAPDAVRPEPQSPQRTA